MLIKNLRVGGFYEARHAGRMSIIQVIGITRDSLTGRQRVQARKLDTRREVVFKSGQKILAEIPASVVQALPNGGRLSNPATLATAELASLKCMS